MSNPPPGRTQRNDDYYWPPAAEVPYDLNVILFFHGLMCFCYNRNGCCEIGIHNKAPHHNFKITVLELTTVPDPQSGEEQSYLSQVYSYKGGPPGSSTADLIRLDVFNPSASGNRSVPGVTFFQGEEFDRENNVGDSDDFRWILDLEGPDFYDQTLKKKPEAMTPRLLIKSGVFYTWQKTKTKFIRRAPNDEKKLGGVAQVIAANIRVENNGYFALRVGGQEVRFNALPGRLYGVLFDNGCPKDVCNYNPDSPVKELRNDFHHYCETFEIPADREEYELAKDLASKSEYGEQQGADSARTTTGPFFEMFNALFGNMLSSDDAPCGAAGYGSSGCIHC